MVPQHVAIIMDGNGRWAQKRHLPRVEGHRAGAKTVRRIVEESRRMGLRYLTLFAFSTENWQRPEDEVSALMSLFVRYLRSELELLTKNGIRLRAIGDRSVLPEKVRAQLEETERETETFDDMQLVIAVSYGGRRELTQAAQSIARKVASGEIDPEQVDEQCVVDNLYAPDIPDPELLIRTSNENRISNFLLWQLAYSEIVLSELFWPDFSVEEFHRCIDDFSKRNRRYGLTGAQAEALETQQGRG